MNTGPQKSYFRRIVLPLIAGTFFTTAFLLVGAYAANLHNSVSPLAAYAPYDPATYGIPYEIAGYKILAVKTSENTACIPAGMLRFTVQSSQPDVQSFLANSGDTAIVRETLQQLPSLAEVHFDLEFIGPAAWNPEQFMSSNAEWNEIMKNGCIKLGGPIIIITDTPDPFAPYDPATFGIPEILAGYRVVAVHTLENTACMLPNAIRLTIQAVEPSADNPMVPVGGGDIIFELKKINPDVQWSLTYIMPGSFAREQSVASMQQWNEAMKNGCIILGGPIDVDTMIPRFTPTPFT